jgi:hypothetical protein
MAYGHFLKTMNIFSIMLNMMIFDMNNFAMNIFSIMAYEYFFQLCYKL